MNAKKTFVLFIIFLSCLHGWWMFICYERNGLTFPVVAGYALLFTYLLIAGAYAGQIKRWMK